MTWKTFEETIRRGHNRSIKAKFVKDDDDDDDEVQHDNVKNFAALRWYDNPSEVSRRNV
jgi:hypothetical protein